MTKKRDQTPDEVLPQTPPASEASEAPLASPETVDTSVLGAETVATPKVEWAEPEPKRRRRWPWIVVPAAALSVGAVIASLTLIAPGVSAAGVPIGGMTRDAAASAISSKLADSSLVLKTADGEVTVHSKDLGASIDANALADKAREDAPLWNVTQWGKDDLAGAVSIDDAAAEKALRAALPKEFVNPTEATVSFKDGAYTSTQSAPGKGISTETLSGALAQALSSDTHKATVDAKVVQTEPKLTTENAKKAADALNGVVNSIGFYVGSERTVPIAPATAASWMDYKVADDGSVAITAKEAEIAKAVPALAQQVNRAAVDGTAIVDTQGETLEEGIKSQTGRELGDTSGIAAAFAKQLSAGNGKYELPVTETKPKVTGVERRIEVNLSTQKTYAYENGKVIREFTISSGRGDYATTPGEFRVRAHVEMQDMGCVPGFDYCTKDVPWVMYFNGDEGFHGTYWHNNFGTPMSHGCVNMTIAEAKWLYDWAPQGTEVSVHY